MASLGLLQGADIWVWEYAKRNGFTLITTAGDFNELVKAHGHPPKVIWLRGCNSPTIDAEALIRTHAARLSDFDSDADCSVLILPGPGLVTNRLLAVYLLATVLFSRRIQA